MPGADTPVAAIVRAGPPSSIVLIALAMASAVPVAAQETIVLPARDRAIEAPTRTLFSVGVMEGAEHEMFGQVAAVAFDREGNLYVLDRVGHRVVVFGPDGRFRQTIGRRGAGPGELQGPSGLAVTGDHVAVLDGARNAVVVYRQDGEYVRNLPFDAGERPGFRFETHPRGGFVYEPMPFVMRMDGPAPEIRPMERLPVIWRTTAAGPRARTIYEGPAPQTSIRQDAGPGGSPRVRIQANTAPVFTPAFQWRILPDGGLVASSSESYRIEVVDGAGRVARIIERGIPPRRVVERDRERARTVREEARASGAGPMTTMGGGLAGGAGARAGAGVTPGGKGVGPARPGPGELTFAETMPVIQALAVDPAGRVWIRRAGSADYDRGPVDVVGSDGRYVGTLPEGTRLPDAFGPDRMAAYIEADDLGVQRVVVRQVPPWRP